MGKLGYNLPRTLSSRVSTNVDEPSFQTQEPTVDGDEVHRQSKYRELDSRRRKEPSRPIFRIGGSVIHDRNTSDEAPAQVAPQDRSISDSVADKDHASGVSPASVVYNTSSDPEKAEPELSAKT